jgi:hypothetical protein
VNECSISGGNLTGKDERRQVRGDKIKSQQYDGGNDDFFN